MTPVLEGVSLERVQVSPRLDGVSTKVVGGQDVSGVSLVLDGVTLERVQVSLGVDGVSLGVVGGQTCPE